VENVLKKILIFMNAKIQIEQVNSVLKFTNQSVLGSVMAANKHFLANALHVKMIK